MANEHQPFATPGNNNSDDLQRQERHADGSQENTEDRKIELAVKEAFKETEDHKQDAVVDKNDKQSKSSGAKQSLWLMRTKRFCYEASVVGLRYVVNPTASPFRRSVWVVLLLVGAGFTTFQIQDRIQYFLSRPINVNLRIQHAKEIRFPTVTICNENRLTKNSAVYFGKRSLQCILDSSMVIISLSAEM